MALIVKVQATPAGSEAISMIQNFRAALAILNKLDGLRAESIGVSSTEMASIFGIQNTEQAQAFSDRWSALLAAYEDTGNVEYAKLRDFVNAFVQIP